MTTQAPTSTPPAPSGTGSDLAKLHADVAMLTLDMTQDQVLELKDRVDATFEQIKATRDSLTIAMIEWLDNNGPIETPTTRYSCGKTKRIRCDNTRETLEAILVALEGDVDAVCKLLASQPIKPGACREVLGDKWDDYFTESWTDKLEVKSIPTHLLKDDRNK